MSDSGVPETVVTVFRSRLRDDALANGYVHDATEAEARARSMPGFVDFKTFTAPDGERVSIVIFDSLPHHNAWRDDPFHRHLQERGRRQYYQSFSIDVCFRHHRHDFDSSDGVR